MIGRRTFLAVTGAAALSWPAVGSAEDYPAPLTQADVRTATELKNAIAAARPGMHIVLADGTYMGTFTVGKGGLAGSPIVIRAQNRLKAVIAGSIPIASTAPFVVLHGLKFSGSPSYAVSLGADNATVMRCWFSAARGVYLRTQQGWRIGYNRFSGNPRGSARDDHIFVDVPTSSAKLPMGLIDRNHFTHTKTDDSSESHHIYVGPSDSIYDPTLSGIIIEYNLIEKSARRRGIYVKRGVVIRYNHSIMSRGISFIRFGDGGIMWGNRLSGFNNGRPIGMINGKNHDIRGNSIETGAVLRLVCQYTSKSGSRYQAADNALLVGNFGPTYVGYLESGATRLRSVSGVKIYAHAGPIYMTPTNRCYQTNTLVAASAGDMTWPQPVTLTATQVGPDAV